MEDPQTFQKWLDQTIKDAKVKLGMTDETIAYILLRDGLKYYLKTCGKNKSPT